MQLLTELLQAGRALRASVGPFCGPRGMSELHLIVLWQCARSEPDGINQRALAESLTVSHAQVSALVEQMRGNELIAAHRPPHDRRRQNWRLTQNGRAMLKSFASDLRTWSESLSDAISQRDIRDLISRLQQVIKASAGASPRDEAPLAPRIKRGAA
jgi:DNA-binding MarR family transcriptional regulator